MTLFKDEADKPQRTEAAPEELGDSLVCDL